jgi:hypothetical protein
MKQKKIYYLLITLMIFSCDTYEENSLDFVSDINAPSNVDFVIDISEDNQAIVKIIPFGDGLLNSTVDFGDDSELSDEITPGNFVVHDYDEEGTYDITINAKGVNGKITPFTKTVDVLYTAPSVPEITVTPRSTDPYTVLVNASSDFGVSYDVYFGEIQDEEPVTILPDDVALYTYSDEGIFNIKVVAHSGGLATSEDTVQYELDSQTLVDFESDLPSMTPYQGASFQVISNPNVNENNDSQNVIEFTKGQSRSFILLQFSETFNLDDWGRLKVKLHSSKIGTNMTLRLRTASNYTASANAISSVENDWEELIFDFSNVPSDKEFNRIFLYPDYNISNTGEVFYYDDIELIY